MSTNLDTVNRYLDGFRRTDHEAILACLTDDIEWTLFGGYHIVGKQAYDQNIDGGPEVVGHPTLDVVRLVEQGDSVMGELTGSIRRADGGSARWSMAELWRMRDGLICERRTWIIELTEDDWH